MREEVGNYFLLQYKARLFLGVAALFVFSLVMSCQELRYMVSGKTADVVVTTRVEKVTPRRGAPFLQQVVGWSYQDGGTMRQKYTNMSLEWERPAGGSLRIQYIPGRDASRIYGQTNKVWVVIFFGSVAAVVVLGLVVAKWG